MNIIQVLYANREMMKMEEAKWEVLEVKNLTKVGEEGLHISTNNRGNGEFSLEVSLYTITEAGNNSSDTYHKYERLGRITNELYIPETERHGIKSKLVSTDKGTFILLIKRPEEE